MNKIILVVLMMVGFIGYSQKKTPYFYIVDNDTIGVVISIVDAQKLDNDGDILKLYEQLSKSYDKSNIQFIKIVDKMNQQIGILNIQNEKYEDVIRKKDVIINDLKEIIHNKAISDVAYEKELDNKNKEISNLTKQLNRSFWQKIGGSAIALAVIAFLVVKQ